MAKTKAEITAIVSGKLYPTHYNALTFNNLKTVVNALSANKQAKLLEGILDGKDVQVGEFLRKEMIIFAKASADVEATALMLDDNLTLAELQIIYP